MLKFFDLKYVILTSIFIGITIAMIVKEFEIGNLFILYQSGLLFLGAFWLYMSQKLLRAEMKKKCIHKKYKVGQFKTNKKTKE